MSVTTLPARQAVVAPTGNPLVPRGMDEALRLADMMSRSKVGIPEHLRNSPGDCLMIVELATRWNMSPFAVAQCSNKVKDKLGYEGKIIHAAIESSGVIDGYVDYEFSGSGDGRTIKVTATRRGEATPRDVEVRLADAKTSNEWWRKTPDQMLVYHGARVWARRWTPGVLLGVYAPDEFDTVPTPHREPEHHAAGTIDHAVMQPAEPVGTSFGNRVDRIIFTVIPKATTLPLLERARAKSDPLLEELDQAGRHDLRDRLIEAFEAARDSLPFDPTVSEQQPDPLSGILAHLATLETGAAIDQWQRTDAMKAAVRAFNKADNDRLGEAVNARRRELAESAAA